MFFVKRPQPEVEMLCDFVLRNGSVQSNVSQDKVHKPTISPLLYWLKILFERPPTPFDVVRGRARQWVNKVTHKIKTKIKKIKVHFFVTTYVPQLSEPSPAAPENYTRSKHLCPLGFQVLSRTETMVEAPPLTGWGFCKLSTVS